MASQEIAVKGEDVGVDTGESVVIDRNCDKEKCDVDKSGEDNNNGRNEDAKKDNEEETKKAVTTENVNNKTQNIDKSIENKGNCENDRPNDGKELTPEKNGVVAVQKPKRTKSRKSLNKIPTTNNINVDMNGNATIVRSDR